MKGRGSTAFLKKSSKKLLLLVAYGVLSPVRVRRRQGRFEKFFWFFLSTKRTPYFGSLV